MDSTVREQIMRSILTAPKVQEAKESTPAPSQEKTAGDLEFAFRNKLRYVHAYEKICKEDSEKWDADTWNAFDAWYHANKKKTTVEEKISASFEARKLREQEEIAKKNAFRKQIFEKVKFIKL